MKIILVVVVVVALVAAAPCAIIWALNTLFALTIPFTFKTWLAALVLGGCVSSSTRRS